MNPNVQRWVKAFNGPLRKHFERWVKRIGHYGPMIEKTLKDEGAPPDLIYLSMIESGFNMHASSTASAVGPWQFIQSTGKMYGLDKEFFVDERKDIIQATQAAARHLKDLYKIYGDWYLAFSAYNAGPGKTNSAIRRGGTKDYWRLCSSRGQLFRQETKDYVPKILAALHIVKNYKKFGYTEKSFGAPLDYERVSVPDATDVNTIAKATQTTPEHIAALNPNLNLGITPPGQKFPVLIPKGTRGAFVRNYPSIPVSKRVSHLQYSTGNNESLADIAKKYSISASSIARLNHSKNVTAKLRPNTQVKIPATKNTLLALAKGNHYSGGNRSGGTKIAYYKIRRGDTLNRIARYNGTSIANLSRWNGLSRNSQLKAGRSLKIYKSTGSRNNWSSGRLVALSNPFSSSTTGEIRMTGVRHIIHKDQQDPDDFIPEPTPVVKDKDVVIPTMVAVADTETEEEENIIEPAMIKTVDGKLIGEGVPEETNPALDTSLATATPVKQKTAVARFHVVKRGETLSGISAKYKMRMSELKTLNKLRSDTVQLNQKLLISGGSALASAQQPQKQPTTKIQSSAAIYQVRPGDTLSVIAKKQGVPLKQLMALNNVRGGNIKVGQKLVLKSGSPDRSSKPATQVATAQMTAASPKVTSSSNSMYVVKPNDTLSSIATRHRVRVSDLKSWNRLTGENIRSGQQLRILKGSLKTTSPAVAKVNRTASGKVIMHLVRSGDTLWSLSRKYGVKVSDIVKWNNLKDNQVRPNQRIKIIA